MIHPTLLFLKSVPLVVVVMASAYPVGTTWPLHCHFHVVSLYLAWQMVKEFSDALVFSLKIHAVSTL